MQHHLPVVMVALVLTGSHLELRMLVEEVALLMAGVVVQHLVLVALAVAVTVDMVVQLPHQAELMVLPTVAVAVAAQRTTKPLIGRVMAVLVVQVLLSSDTPVHKKVLAAQLHLAVAIHTTRLPALVLTQLKDKKCH
jgi:hypothetical protein